MEGAEINTSLLALKEVGRCILAFYLICIDWAGTTILKIRDMYSSSLTTGNSVAGEEAGPHAF